MTEKQKVENKIRALASALGLTPKPSQGRWYFYGPSPLGLASPDPGMDDSEAVAWLEAYRQDKENKKKVCPTCGRNLPDDAVAFEDLLAFVLVQPELENRGVRVSD